MNINRVILTGNLTRDPELRSTNSGLNICSMRLAVNTRRKGSDGSWEDKPNYFDVTVFGGQGENCARFLTKGRPCAVDGRLEWREFTDKDGNKRQAVEIVAESVQFLGDGSGGGNGNGGGGNRNANGTERPADTGAAQPAATGGGRYHDDDIPF